MSMWVMTVSRCGVVLCSKTCDRVAETADGTQGRRRIDDRQVAAVDELLDAERLDAELERAPAVRGRVEEHVAVQGRAHLDAARGEPLELERAAAGQDREDHANVGRRAPARRPSQARYACLHLRRVDGERRPPRAAPPAARRRPTGGRTGSRRRLELVEHRRERIEVGERSRAHARADEAGARPARWPEPRTALLLRRPARQCRPPRQPRSSARSVAGSASCPKRRLQREHGDVGPVAVEHAMRASRSCSAGSNAKCPSRRVELAAADRGGVARASQSASMNAAGQRCWWMSTVGIVSQPSPRSGRASTSGSRSGSESPSPTNGTTCPHRTVERERCRLRARCLGGHRPARRAGARPRRRAIRARPSRRAGGRQAAPSSSGPRFPRPGSSKPARARPAARAERASEAIAWTAMPNSLRALSARPLRAPSPSLRPVSDACRSFTARSAAAESTGARASRARSSAVASGWISKFPTEIIRSSAVTTSGFDWAALSSSSTCARTKPNASRAAPWTWGSARKLSGSCSARASPRSLRAGRRCAPSVTCSPAVRTCDADRRVQGVTVRSERLVVERPCDDRACRAA